MKDGRRTKLDAMIEGWRLRHMPGVAQRLLDFSLVLAWPKLDPAKPLGILVDSNILHHAVTHETRWISTGQSLWGEKHPMDTGYLARIPVHNRETQKVEHEDIKYLPGLVRLFKTQRLKLWSSIELKVEQEQHPNARFDAVNMFDYTLLKPNELECVDGSPWAVLLDRAFSDAGSQQARLASSDDKRYHELVRVLGAKNSQDAWHIRTAEIHSLPYFLTMDYRLVRNVAAQKRNRLIASLTTEVITPSALGSRLGMIPYPPVLLSYTNASYPVRADLSLPGDKRGPSFRPKTKSSTTYDTD